MEYELVAQRMREAMNDKNITAAELSRQSGVGKGAISHYMNGSHCPHNVNAVMLANVLGVDPVWLMGFDVPKHKEISYDMKLSKDEHALIQLYRSDDETYKKMLEMIIFTYEQNKKGGETNESN